MLSLQIRRPHGDSGRLVLSSGLIILFQWLGPQSRNHVSTAENEKLSLENMTFYEDDTGRIMYGYMCE